MGGSHSVENYHESVDYIVTDELEDIRNRINEAVKDCDNETKTHISNLKRQGLNDDDIKRIIYDIYGNSCITNIFIQGSSRKTAPIFQRQFPNLSIVPDEKVVKEDDWSGCGGSDTMDIYYWQDCLTVSVPTQIGHN